VQRARPPVTTSPSRAQRPCGTPWRRWPSALPRFRGVHANEIIALVSTAWLGPADQIHLSDQRGEPRRRRQTAHRDYHLGLPLRTRVAARYPRARSPVVAGLTLQGASRTATCPSRAARRYLPHSQKYDAGYLAWRRPEFGAYFDATNPDTAREGGCCLLSTPALPAAGHNRSATSGMANQYNLLGFGRAIGDRGPGAHGKRSLSGAAEAQGAGPASQAWLDNVVAACAEGYAFRPTSTGPAGGGLAPLARSDTVARALRESGPGTAAPGAARPGAERRETTSMGADTLRRPSQFNG